MCVILHQADTDVVVLTSAVLTITTMLPLIPAYVSPWLPELFDNSLDNTTWFELGNQILLTHELEVYDRTIRPQIIKGCPLFAQLGPEC